MNHSSDDTYTIMIFRGATATPRRIKIRKTTVKRVVIFGILLLCIQAGILAHYTMQFSQVAELKVLQKEITESRGQTSAFSVAIDEMKQRMLVMQQLNRKLQTMFGLEPDPMGTKLEIDNGQGGEEIPFEFPLGSESQNEESEQVESGTNVQSFGVSSQSNHVVNIKSGLTWLGLKAVQEKEILEKLSSTAGERVERWASTPSIWPVKGPITSKFGPRVSPFTGKKAFHSGLDIGSPRGREIRAPASGKVVVAAFDARMGKFVRIDHGFGMETTYGHLSKILVKYGKKVNRGDLIGLVGSTGKFSTGPHLHYQVAVNDKVVNPVQYILD
jgi:murein DD-endopeptidase MepM/ murein hydrolase activator NlpD